MIFAFVSAVLDATFSIDAMGKVEHFGSQGCEIVSPGVLFLWIGDDIAGAYLATGWLSSAWSVVMMANTLFLTDFVKPFAGSAIALSGLIRTLFAIAISVIHESDTEFVSGNWFLCSGCCVLCMNYWLHKILCKEKIGIEKGRHLIEFEQGDEEEGQKEEKVQGTVPFDDA